MRNSYSILRLKRMLQHPCHHPRCLTQGNHPLLVAIIRQDSGKEPRVPSLQLSEAPTARRRLQTSLRRSGQGVHLIRWVSHTATTATVTRDPNKAIWTLTLTPWLPLGSISEPVNTATVLVIISLLHTLVRVRILPVVLKSSTMIDSGSLFQ